MTQTNLSKWLKGIIGGIGVCGAIIYGYLIPLFGKEIVRANPEFSHWYVPWLTVIRITAVPCFLILYFGWKISTEIGRDNSFSVENARYLKYISGLAHMNHPGIFLASLMIEFAGTAIAVAAAVLSHLVQKAAEIQKENELTI